MKTSVFFIGSILLGSFLYAQDTLYTVTGEKQIVKVLEITPTELKYKKTSNLDGPVYTVNKNTIALVEFKNGSKEIFGTGTDSSDPAQANSQNNPTSVNNYYNQGSFWGGPRIRVVWAAAPFVWGANWGYGGYYRSRHHYHHSSHHYYYGRRH